MKIDISNINARTKAIVVMALGYLISINIPAVKDAVIPYLANHPHLSTTFGGIMVLASALQNPTVRNAIGLKSDEMIVHNEDGTKMITKKSSIVPVEPGTTVDSATKTETVAEVEPPPV